MLPFNLIFLLLGLPVSYQIKQEKKNMKFKFSKFVFNLFWFLVLREEHTPN
jgi:hypothetical protein